MTKRVSTVGPLKTVYLLGGGALLLRLARWLADKGLDVGIITSPRHAAEPAPEGRDFLAAAKAITPKVLSTEDVASPQSAAFLDFSREAFALSLGAAWIFRKDQLEGIFHGRLFNLHGTRLPQDRGGGGFSWQVLMNNRLGFCVLHRVDGGVDSGEIVSFREYLYPASCRVPADFMAVYEERNLGFLQEFFTAASGKALELASLPQQEYFSTYWPRLNTPLHGWIDWDWPADALDRFVCAFDDPYPGAQTLLEGKPVRLKKSVLSLADGVFHPFQHGLVYRSNGRWLSVAVQGGSLLLQEVKDEAGNDLLAKVKPGDRFHTPAEKLASARRRVTYTPTDLKAE